LLVIDNVEDCQSVRPWLPDGATTGCRTLITARFSDWPPERGIRTIAIDVLEPEPSRHFLLARTGRIAEEADLTSCDDLAKALGYLPLALEQAGAYIAAPGAAISFAGYLRLYETAATDLLARKALGSTEYPDAVITTWQTTVAKLSPESRAVLRLCAWYADTPIPRALVMEGAEAVLALAEAFGPLMPLSGPTAAELRMRDALTGLARYSMILDSTDDSFRIHGLVQTVERVQAEAECDDAAARDAALERLKIVFPDNVFRDPAVWPLCRELRPHLDALDRHFPDAITRPSLADLLESSGRFLHASGALREAEPVLRRALDKHEQARGKDDLATAGGAHNLAHCLIDFGNPAAGEPLLRRALDIYEQRLGMDHRNTLVCMNDLAVSVGKQGRLSEEAEQLRRVLAHEERVLGYDHEDTIRTLHNLAYCLAALGDAAEALPFDHRALDSYERVLGPDHPDTLASVNNLAARMEALGDAAGALPLYRRAFESSERVLGAEHPRTFMSLVNMAKCLRATGNAAGALPLHRRALDSFERVLGADHSDTLTAVNNLAACLGAMGDAAGALLLFRRALDGSERVLGPEHPATLVSVNNLAACMEDLGDAAGALPLYRRALDGYERVHGPEHPNTLSFVANLASCLDRLGRLDEAVPLRHRQIDGLERRMGADHPDVLTACNNLAVSMRKAGRPDLALSHARRVAETSERVLAHDPPRLLFRRGNLALTLLMTGETGEARRLLSDNWAWPAPDCANTTPGIAFLGLLADLLDGRNGAGAIGRLKTLLLGPKLPMAAGVAYPWDGGYLLDYLAPRLPDGHYDFLTVLLAAINDPEQAGDLDRLPIWREAEAVPRDTPWPVTETVAGGRPDGPNQR
jgi:tetratricopeptide (TPR) repeat protein